MSPAIRPLIWQSSLLPAPVLIALFGFGPALGLCGLLALVLSYVAHRAHAKNRREEWAAAARELGLERRADGSLWGAISGFQLTVQIEKRRRGERRVRSRVFSIDSLGKIPRELWLRPMPTKGHGLPIGDRAFEARVHSQGPEAVVLAALSNACRELPVFDRPWSGQLRDGVLEYIDDDEPLVALTRDLVSAARALSMHSSEILPRLTTNLENDPIPQFRARNLQAIDRLLRDDRAAAHARARCALLDPHPAVRLIGARMLPDVARLMNVAQRDPDPHVRAELLLHLSRIAGAQLRPTVRIALASPKLEERRAAILACGNLGGAWAAHELAPHTNSPHLALVLAAVQALSQLGSPHGQPALIGLLSHESPTIRAAASTALAKVGTVAAVQPLLACGAAAAARAIQARLHGADAGRLSLAPDAHSGALSEAERRSEHGALSVAEKPTESEEPLR